MVLSVRVVRVDPAGRLLPGSHHHAAPRRQQFESEGDRATEAGTERGVGITLRAEAAPWSGELRPPLVRQRLYPETEGGLKAWIAVGGSPESVVHAARYRMPRDEAYRGVMLFAFSVAPTTTADQTASMSEAVAEAVRVVRDSGLPHETTSMFTTIEGQWDEVMPVIRAATDAVLAVAPRVSLVLKADLRPGRTGELRGKVERVDRHLAGGDGAGATGPTKGDDDEVVAP